MKYLFAISIYAVTLLSACAPHEEKPTTENTDISKAAVPVASYDKRPPAPAIAPFVYTDTVYAAPSGGHIRIQNSYPKGGSIAPGGVQYTDAAGKTYAFAAFWTQITNDTPEPVKLVLNAPSDSFAIFDPVDSYLKILLPLDSPTYDKLSMFNYGLTDIESFLDAHLNMATEMRRTIHPSDTDMYYVVALTYRAAGMPRAALFIRDQTLFYRIEVAPHGSGTVPIGTISFNGSAWRQPRR